MRRRGHELVPFEDAADAYIVNTCTVTAVSDKKSRQMIRQARKARPRRGGGRVRPLPPNRAGAQKALGVDLVAGTADRMGFLDDLERQCAGRAPPGHGGRHHGPPDLEP
ncbi:MAG: hypothetical protein ACLSAF_08120 [Intestinimonas sp.]